MENKRISWVDCTKGVAILLVILGHTVVNGGRFGNLARALIFSFHMPLFFAISSFTFHYSRNEEEFVHKTKKAAKHLLLPVLIVTAIYTVWEILNNPSLISDFLYWKTILFELIVGSGVAHRIGSMEIPSIGVPWFLYALFLGRTLYDFLCLQVKEPLASIVVWIISFIGVAIGMSGNWLPFSLDISFAVLPFFWFGKELKTKGSITSLSVKKIAFYATCWLITLFLTAPVASEWTYLELAARHYPLHPIDFICAAFGSLLFYEVGILLSKIMISRIAFSWIGKNSLYLLLVHDLDGIFKPLWYVNGNQFFIAARRIAADLIVLCIFVVLKTVIYAVLSKKDCKTGTM
ncbi:MAG: acyltransferase family protein [Oscillospiraceae bacterium]|nr:acyltransferase family protein [Oscillospiraceae bacterium]